MMSQDVADQIMALSFYVSSSLPAQHLNGDFVSAYDHEQLLRKLEFIGRTAARIAQEMEPEKVIA